MCAKMKVQKRKIFHKKCLTSTFLRSKLYEGEVAAKAGQGSFFRARVAFIW